MINTADLVELDDPELVRSTGSALKTALDNINTRADNVKTTWSGLAGHYKAPEQNDVLTAMNVPVTESDQVAGHGATVKNALNTYATELERLRTRKSSLITDLNTFYADKKRIDDDNKDNNPLEDLWDGLTGEGTKLLDRENALNGRAAALLADKEKAERECANAIGDIWGGEHYEAADETWVNDTTTYGMSADGYEEMSKAGDAPWGHPEMWSSGNWFVRGAMIDDGIEESIMGTLSFFGNLVGFGGGGKAKAAWSGLGQLAKDGWSTSLVGSFFTSPEEQKAASERLLAVGKGIIGWDNWDTSGWQTGGSVGLDVVLTFATGGTAGAAKGSIKAGAAARFLKFVGGTSKIDIKATAAAMKVRLSSSLTAKLDSFKTMGQRFNETMESFGPKPAYSGVPDVPTRPHHLPTQPHEPPTGPGQGVDPEPTRPGGSVPDNPSSSTPHTGHDTPHSETPSSPAHDTTPDVPDRAPTKAPDGGPTHDPAGREYTFDENLKRHVEGDPEGTFRDKSGRLQDSNGYIDDKNPAHMSDGERGAKGTSTDAKFDPDTQAHLDSMARDQAPLRTQRADTVRAVNDLAFRHGIDPADVSSTSKATTTVNDAVAAGRLSSGEGRELMHAVRSRNAAGLALRNASENLGERAAHNVADARGEKTIVDGEGAGSGRADRVTLGDNPPRLTVYEAKGGSAGLGPGRAGNQQGSTAYTNDLLSRDPNIAEGMRSFVEKNPDSPISAAIRDGSIEVRYDLVQAKPVTSATGHVSVRTRVTEMILQRDRIQLPDLEPEGIR